MGVTAAEWALTVIVLLGIILVDLWVVDRRPQIFTSRAATRWVLFYALLAAVFAGFLWQRHGANFAGDFLAGYITEYSLSVDNLFVFLVIMSSFAVPPVLQHRVLLWGVLIALTLRGGLIILGAGLLERFVASFFLFGGFLLWTAWHVWANGDAEPDPEGNVAIRWLERHVPTTREYHGHRLTVMIDGARHVTPMLLVIVSIGTTDLLFALDSIPAIFGLTQEAYIVFTANAFALMGLRQLYFLLHGYLERLIYLSKGLAIILAFVALKLILHAVEEMTGTSVLHISTWVSLAVIVLTLSITALASLIAVRRHPERIESSRDVALEREAAEREGEALLALEAESNADGVSGEGGPTWAVPKSPPRDEASSAPSTPRDGSPGAASGID